MSLIACNRYERIIADICNLNWSGLNSAELTDAAQAYYFFSIQFRENLEIALAERPHDEKLAELQAGECDTDNLSPFPGVAEVGEKLNHDEFMRRAILLADPRPAARARVERFGESYLARVRSVSLRDRARSIASYEDGGLERVFTAMLAAPAWPGPCLAAFHHFLVEHIRFDSDAGAGHGALSRHLVPDDGILPLWGGFHDLLVSSAPALLA